MAEYIEREAALNNLAKSYFAEVLDDLIHAEDAVNAVPAADVRPVVLCRDCKYSYDSVGGWCCSHGVCVDCIVREDFFCADGEKKENR